MADQTDDPAAASDPNPGDPGAGGGEPAAPADLAAVVADFEAQALAELNEGITPPKAPGAGEGKGGEEGAPGAPDPIDDWINRSYQGDRQAAADSLVAQRVHGQQQDSRIAALEAALAGRPEPTRDIEAEAKALRDADPDVQSLDRTITQTAERNKQIAARQLEIVDDAYKLGVEIERLDAELPHLEDPKEYNKKFAEVARLRNKHTQLTNEYNVNELRVEKNRSDIVNSQRELRRAEQAISQRLAEEEAQADADRRGGQLTRKTFDAAYDLHTKPYSSIDPKSARGKFVYAAIRSQLADYLDSRAQQGQEGLDAHGIFDATQRLIRAYADAHELKAAVAGAPPPKPKTPPPPRARLLPPRPAGSRPGGAPLRDPANPDPGDNGSGRPATPRTVADIYSSPDLIRARAAAIQRAMAQGGRRPS